MGLVSKLEQNRERFPCLNTCYEKSLGTSPRRAAGGINFAASAAFLRWASASEFSAIFLSIFVCQTKTSVFRMNYALHSAPLSYPSDAWILGWILSIL